MAGATRFRLTRPQKPSLFSVRVRRGLATGSEKAPLARSRNLPQRASPDEPCVGIARIEALAAAQ